MHLLKNPEVKRLFILMAVFFALALLLALIFCHTGMNYYLRAAGDHFAAVASAVVELYPQAEEEVLRQIRGADEETISRGRALLSRYGLTAGELLPATALARQVFRANLFLFLLLAVLACGIPAWLVFRFLKAQYYRINELTAYASRINSGDYSLDIRDNREGEISLLKNEIYKITTALREQAESLQREKTALADSLADISHQLKTPLTSLFVLTDLLDEEQPAEVKAGFLDRIRAQLQRVEWLVTSLLKLSKLDSGAVTLKKEEVSVEELIETALQPLQIPLEIKRQQLSIHGQPGARFKGDLAWTAEALLNIVKNCIEHTPEKGFIEISYTENPLYTEIIVADNGTGIDAADLPHIFDRFYKGKNAGENSVGIGLAMSRAIITRQGGEINVVSPGGRGTTFTIRFYNR